VRRWYVLVINIGFRFERIPVFKRVSGRDQIDQKVVAKSSKHGRQSRQVRRRMAERLKARFG